MSNSWDGVLETEEYRTTLARAEALASDNLWILNPDNERVEKVVGLMTMNYTGTGEYYCPCKQSHPLDPERDTVCPCPELRQEIRDTGHCFCRLFYR
ncbi:MAG: hypothetical protein AVO35_11335 [Candidatus Aegiribacteria sp. MLS_C]|nr:MAG: hypothetical protein AVO35_11335 [Candidatus Aegiribacteria sp. MLS_C]